MEGFLSDPRAKKMSPAAGKKSCFLCFWSKKNQPAAGQKLCFVCFWRQKFSACGGHTTKLVSKEFLRAKERASTIRKTI